MRSQWATVTSAAAIEMVALPDDDELHDRTEALSKARIVSRGPRATGALRAAGLPEESSPESESSREVMQYLREGGIEGLRVAVQLHGATAEWVAAMLMRAVEMGIEDEVLAASRTDVHAMCVGPVTARPLVRLGVPTSAPERMRLGALARHITDELPLLQSRTVTVAGHVLEIRGTCVLVDGEVKDLPPAGMATIRALAHQPGNVVSRGDLLNALPGGGHRSLAEHRPGGHRPPHRLWLASKGFSDPSRGGNLQRPSEAGPPDHGHVAVGRHRQVGRTGVRGYR